MSELKFNIGQRVQKTKGYKFPGIVIGTALKTDGRRLYLVECTAHGASGMCHIFGENDLEEDKGVNFTFNEPPAIPLVAFAYNLSITERSVLKRICNLGPNKAIANDMGIAETTVKVHVKSILGKTRILNRTLLAVWAVKNGLDQ